MKEIRELEDIRLLVETFYAEIKNDSMLGPIFNEVIEDRWPEHLEKMVKFWDTVLLGGKMYFGKPFVPHATLPVNHEHFDRWQYHFEKTVDQLFYGQKADEAKWRASKMAILFLGKIEYIKNNPGKMII